MDPNDLIGVLIGGGVALLCIVIGVVLYTGHGSMMMAGYNTMSKKERDRINEKALGKAVGAYVILIGAMVGVIIYAAKESITWLVYTLLAIMVLGTIPFLIYVNKSKRFKK